MRVDFRVIYLLMWLALPGRAATSLPKPVGYVNDFAHVMSPKTIAELDRICGKVERATRDRIDVVTVTTTGGEPIEQYAAGLQQAWRRNSREAMVLVAVGQRQRWIAAESGLATVLPAVKLEEISGQMVPMLRNNDYDGAMQLAVNELAAKMSASADAKMNLRLPWGARLAVVPAGAGWLSRLMWGLGALMFASFGVWAYASKLGESVRQMLGRRMRRERQ